MKRLLIAIFAALLLFAPVTPPMTLWLYGAPQAWGVLGDGAATPEQSAANFHYWSDEVQAIMGDMQPHADLILYSGNGYNPLVEETARLLLADPAVTVSLNLHPPASWTLADVERQVNILLSGDSGYVSRELWSAYRGRISLSLDLEMPVFGNDLYIHARDINRINAVYQRLYPGEAVAPLYLYNFGNMVNSPAELDPNIITIFNGISQRGDTLAARYRNMETQVGRPTGIMFFVLPHLGERQRTRFMADLRAVQNWLESEDLQPPILGFQ